MKTEGREVVRAAVIQTAPIAFNREQTVEKVRSLVNEAARQGAQLVVFPEAFLSAYPRGMHFGAVIGSRTPEGRDAFYHYWESAVDIPGPTISALADIAQTSQVYLVIGVIERAGGTLYCTVVFFAPNGQYLGKHRKVMPTAAERIVWGCGDGSTLPVFDTPLGKLGAVICWENYMPLLRMTMYTKGIELYCAPTADGRDNWIHSMQHIALEGRCFVLSCNQFARRSDYPKDYETPFGDDPSTILSRGGSCIVSPLGEMLAGPVFDRDALLIADLDRRDIIRGKMDFDVVGHYARPDLFHLSINEHAYQTEKGFVQARSTEKEEESSLDKEGSDR